MRIKMFLAAICLSVALCTPAFSDDSGSAPGCRRGHFREWAKAVFSVQCKTCLFRPNPPAPAAAGPTSTEVRRCSRVTCTCSRRAGSCAQQDQQPRIGVRTYARTVGLNDVGCGRVLRRPTIRDDLWWVCAALDRTLLLRHRRPAPVKAG